MSENGRGLSSYSALPNAYRLPGDGPRETRVDMLPRNVYVEVTSRCNLLCETCPHTHAFQEARRDLTLDEFKAIVDQFPHMERAVLHGIGEPLLNQQLPAMVRLLKARDITVLFNSNGTVLTPALQDALIHAGLDEYRVSLDAADPEEYARIRGRPFLEKVVGNLQSFVANKRRLDVDLPRLSLWCVAMRENMGQLLGLVRLAARVGIPELYVQRLVYPVEADQRHGMAQAEQAVFGRLEEDERRIIEACVSLSQELGVAFTASAATDPVHSLGAAASSDERPWMACRRPWTTAYVTANGNVLPCCISPFATAIYDELVLGNVWEASFASIWNDGPYRAWRGALLSANPPRTCSGCGVHWSL